MQGPLDFDADFQKKKYAATEMKPSGETSIEIKGLTRGDMPGQILICDAPGRRTTWHARKANGDVKHD